MSETNPQSRRRRLPTLGVTTVGLAVGAGSLGLYTGATAEPIKSPLVQPQNNDQTAWTAAKPTAPAPQQAVASATEPAPLPASVSAPAPAPIPTQNTVAAPAPMNEVIQTSAIDIPTFPVVPALPAQNQPNTDAKSGTPAIPNLPNQWPPLPKAPDATKPAAPAVPELPKASDAVKPVGPAVPELPKAPEVAKPAAPELPKAPEAVKPTVPELPKAPEVAKPTVPELPKAVEAVKPSAPELPKAVEAIKPVAPELPKAVEAIKPAVPELPNAVEALKPAMPELPKAAEALKPAVPELPKATPNLELPKPNPATLAVPVTPDVPKPAELVTPSTPAPEKIKSIDEPAAPRANAPVVPAPETPAPETPAAVPAPANPVAVTPVAPAPEKPAEVAPPMQPAKSVDPVQPVGPAPSNLNLPSAQPGLTLKTESPAPTAPIVPGVGAEKANLVSMPKTGSSEALTAPHASSPLTTAPGDPAMISNVPFLRSAILGAALAAAPVSAQAQGEKTPAPKPEQKDVAKADELIELKKKVDDLAKELATAKSFRETTEDVLQGRKNAETGKTDAGLISKMLDFDARLKRIEETLLRLEQSIAPGTKSSTSAYPTKDQTTPMTGPKSVVRIVNEYPVQISMLVNGKSHRVEPNETKLVEIAPGAYTYELLHAGAQATNATIKDGETITLRIK